MSNIKTNLPHIKEILINLLYTDITPTKIEIIVSHPFTNTMFVMGKKKMLDLSNEADLQVWRNILVEMIQKQDSLIKLFLLLNKPYRLTALKFSSSYISDEDLGKILASFWISIEMISSDANVSGKQIVAMFKRASKETLMSESERKMLQELPDKVAIYRGVTSFNHKQEKALSWTIDKKVAIWFANRYDTGTGEIWELTVPKENILCYFAKRGESEVIVDLYSQKFKIHKTML